MLTMKNIWICGSSGMLGSHFTRLLEQNEMAFMATDYELDITNLTAVCEFVRMNKISHIINCAAYTNVDAAEEDPKNAYLINAMGPHNLGIAGRRHGSRVIHFSTDYVFDGRSAIPYTEEDYCTPLGAYGMSKLAGEIKLLDEHEEACIIRTSWLFGFPGKNFVDTMLRLMKEKEVLRIVHDQIGRPTYCQDLADTALALLDETGIYHFANQGETSWYAFAVEIHRQALELGIPLMTKKIEPILTSQYPTPAKRPANSTLSTKKIENTLQFFPRPWKEALADYLVVIQENATLCPCV
jgi:dTDP-4-dehydrorhamnose reductase